MSSVSQTEKRPLCLALTETTLRLQQLVGQIMKETDPIRYDELGAEIWRVLDEREHLREQESHAVEQRWHITRAHHEDRKVQILIERIRRQRSQAKVQVPNTGTA